MGRWFAKYYDRVTRRSEEQGLSRWRRDLLAAAEGTTVEIGAGTGLNLPWYPPDGKGRWQRLVLTEPDRHMHEQLAAKLAAAPHPELELVLAPGERLPMQTASVDTVVSTLVLCSVADPAAVLAEACRVLRPGGRVLFVEHGAHPGAVARIGQTLLQPLWRCVAGGCRLNRRPLEVLEAAGFELVTVVAEDMPAAPWFVRTAWRGVARRR